VAVVGHSVKGKRDSWGGVFVASISQNRQEGVNTCYYQKFAKTRGERREKWGGDGRIRKNLEAASASRRRCLNKRLITARGSKE